MAKIDFFWDSTNADKNIAVFCLDRFKIAQTKIEKIGRHARRGVERDLLPLGRELTFFLDRHVGESRKPPVNDQRDIKCRFECWFVETGKSRPGIGRLKLRSKEVFRFA